MTGSGRWDEDKPAPDGATVEIPETSYDSAPATYEHIAQVRGLVMGAAFELLQRGHEHDASKLREPEKSAFDVITPRLHGVTYGSEEYRATMAEFRPALDHHVLASPHHPEHFGEAGIHGMSLIDLLEMLCDWIAASRRHADGDVRKSIAINAERFGYGEEVAGFLLRTIDDLEALEVKIPQR